MIPYSTQKLEIFSTADVLNVAAAEFIITIANKTVTAKGRFTLALSGGETPQALYALLTEMPFREQMPWKKTFIFWGDERCVPSTDEKNNAYQARIRLLDRIEIPASNIHAVPVNLPPAQAANSYEKELQLFFGKEIPRFDLVLLGLGENGHTASLFPGTTVIDEHEIGIREVYVEEEKMFRITMTAPLINQAHTILFLVTGEKKSKILNTILTSPFRPDKYPAQLIKPVNGLLYWFADKKAASVNTQCPII